MDKEYEDARSRVDRKLYSILADNYGPSHTIDVLKDCIAALKPFAEKEKEVQHA